MLLVLLAACSPLRSQSGYSDEFTVPASIQVGRQTAAGLVWEPVDTSGRFEGVVIASWCPTCKQLLAARAANPELAAATPNLYFLAEETPMHLEGIVAQGQMTPGQSADTQARMAADGALVMNPKAFAGIDPKAVHWDDVPAKWFPYFFTCEAGKCEGWSGHW